MGSNRRYPNLDRDCTIHEWKDGWTCIEPPIFKTDSFAECEARWAKELVENPNRLLTFSRGRIIHTHPDTNWRGQPPLLPDYSKATIDPED